MTKAPSILLVAVALVTLVGCASPTRDTSSRPNSLSDRSSALDALQGEGVAPTCGVDGVLTEHGGFGSTPLIFDHAPGVIRALNDGVVLIEVIPNGVMVEFAWPTDTSAAYFHKDQPVHLTRQSRWDSATGTLVDVSTLANAQAEAVFVSARRSLPEGVGNDLLTLETPLGKLEMGTVECERVHAIGCDVEREQRLDTNLTDGSVVGIDSPLSREAVLLDWARGSRVGTIAGCAGAESAGVEETLEVAYFAPAPDPENVLLAWPVADLDEI